MPKSIEGNPDRARKLRAVGEIANGLAREITTVALWATHEASADETREDVTQAIGQLRERLLALRRMVNDPSVRDLADQLEALIAIALATDRDGGSVRPAAIVPGQPRGALLLVTEDASIARAFALKITPDYRLTTERTHADALRWIRARVPCDAVVIDLRVVNAFELASAALATGFYVACFPSDALPAELRERVSVWRLPLEIEQIRGSLHGSARRLRAARPSS